MMKKRNSCPDHYGLIRNHRIAAKRFYAANKKATYAAITLIPPMSKNTSIMSLWPSVQGFLPVVLPEFLPAVFAEPGIKIMVLGQALGADP